MQINRRRRQKNNLLLLTVLSWTILAASAQPQSTAGAQYVGSQRCEHCHAEQYAGWKQTRMANVVRDPAAYPDAVLGDFTHPDPARTFDLKQVAFVYGSRWKQRYFTQIGDDYYVLPAQWDIAKKRWLPYHVENGADWWVPFYGESNLERPTGPLCDGCHSVNYNIDTKKVTEWNVGCEKCHGPGSLHVAHPTKENIVNPGRLDLCARQRHLHPMPQPGAAAGQSHPWQVLRLARRLRARQTAGRLLEARRAEARVDQLLPVRRHDRPQKPHAGKRLRAKQHVPPRGSLLRLP